ncbi:hypothetical protein F4808DRAFT_458154 [Astrocystis sublimbata]|nr:hypothetical protein F4808DRAFT_458154 [Astrocystis sublimbata]
MAFTPGGNATGGGHQRSLSPTAETFAPKTIEAKKDALHLGFVTQTVPALHRYAGIVGLCTVPDNKASMEELGWHVADFLAYRALLCGDNPPKAQTWLSMSDIPALVEEQPERYVHGKQRRLVGSAVHPGKQQNQGGQADRADDIQVEKSPDLLKESFIAAVKQKLEIVKKYRYPLLLIICGRTSLEQDIYFGTIDDPKRYTMANLRQDLGQNIDDVEVAVVTPCIFSAGWQVNASFGRQRSVQGNQLDFLARQFGGTFAQDLSKTFVGWKCPALDEKKVDPRVRTERFPGPARPSEEVKQLMTQVTVKLQSCLIGGMTATPTDHSFSFYRSTDEWEKLIGNREKSPDHRSLSWYEHKWTELPTAQGSDSADKDKGYGFLGNAFGGTKKSQLNHIRFLVVESYMAWPDHWASNFGQETKLAFERIMGQENPQDVDCHEVFNVLEHRARQSNLGDAIVRCFDLPLPHNQRCRDWDHYKWKQELSNEDKTALITYFGTVFRSVPGPGLPPGVNPNNLSKLQRRLESGANYVRAALGFRFLTSKGSSKAATDRIEDFLQAVKAKQAELLASDSEIHRVCCNWLSAIGMPIRGLGDAVSALKGPQVVEVPNITINDFDGDEEYEVYQEADIAQSDNATSTPIAEGYNSSHGDDPFIIDHQQHGAVATNFSAMFVKPTSGPPIVIRRPQEEEEEEEDIRLPGAKMDLPELTVDSPVEKVEKSESPAITGELSQEKNESVEEDIGWDADEQRILKALHYATNREERARLTGELAKLYQSHDCHDGVDTKPSGNVVQRDSFDAPNSFTAPDKEKVAASPLSDYQKWHEVRETPPIVIDDDTPPRCEMDYGRRNGHGGLADNKRSGNTMQRHVDDEPDKKKMQTKIFNDWQSSGDTQLDPSKPMTSTRASPSPQGRDRDSVLPPHMWSKHGW